MYKNLPIRYTEFCRLKHKTILAKVVMRWSKSLPNFSRLVHKGTGGGASDLMYSIVTVEGARKDIVV
jgi:hypothetical protein